MPETGASLSVRTLPTPALADFKPSTPRPRKFAFGTVAEGSEPAFRVAWMGGMLARVHGDAATLDAALAVALEVLPDAGSGASLVVWSGRSVAAVVRPLPDGAAKAVVFRPEGLEMRRYPSPG